MLRFFSKLEHSRKIVLIFFTAILLVGLVAFYIPDNPLTAGRVGAEPGDGETVVAKVGAQEIKLKDYRKVLQSYVSIYSRGGALNPQMIKALNLDTQALDQLIEQKVIINEGSRLGLIGSDTEVSDTIVKMSAFTDPETGKFIGLEEYRRQLALRGENIGDFEGAIREGVVLDKLRRYLMSSAQVSDRAIEEEFRQNNTKVSVVYAVVEKDKIKDKLKLSDEDLRAYYDSHKEEFKATDTVRQVEYLYIPTDKVAESLKLTDEDLKAAYEKNKQMEPRVSIIKINVKSGSAQDEQAAQAKINELALRVKGTESQKPEDFAAVARGNSEDTASAAKGGDIGFVKKDANRPNDWKQRAHFLKPGQIDGPFRDGNSWYLVKVSEERVIPFEEVKPTLVAGERNRRSYAEANKLADKAYELFTESKDIHKAATAMAADLKVPADSLIRKTPFFKNGDSLPEIGSNPAFEEAIGKLNKGEIGDKISIPGGFAIPRLIDTRDKGTQLSFEEAKNQVDNVFRRQRELTLVKDTAFSIINQSKTADEFKELVKQNGLELKTDDNNLTSYPASNLATLQQIRAAVTQVKAGEVSKVPIKVGVNYLIFAATSRTEPDLSQLAVQRDGIRERLMNEQGSMIYDAYVKGLRKRYDEQGKIKINKNVI
ncbi:MAG TPA: peptidyl-prolyl cis-trans isomerase, partial [Blastocatellia bacterium]|nr:peptidyl-prolyl cis-trans isomerase [Blastocatellia bacterium]